MVVQGIIDWILLCFPDEIGSRLQGTLLQLQLSVKLFLIIVLIFCIVFTA